MGSSSSKAARTAVSSAPRRYPTRAPPSSITQAAKTTPSSTAAEAAPSPQAAPPRPSGPTVHPTPEASETRTEAVDRDSSDPVYSENLRTLGAVQPNPILSHSSTNPADPTTATSPSAASTRQRRPHEQLSLFDAQTLPASAFAPAMSTSNPAIRVLHARQEAQERAELEFTQRGVGGREFLDVSVIRQVLTLRDKRGMSDEEVEKHLELKPGVVARLGPRGMIEAL